MEKDKIFLSSDSDEDSKSDSIEEKIVEKMQEKQSQKSNIKTFVKDETMVKYENYYKKTQHDPGLEGRKASRIIFLRSFNNWIKACMIQRVSSKLGNNLSALDLCCGRGGDLEKYFKSKFKLYVGADLAEELLRNAIDRIEKLQNEKYKNNFETKCFFITEDISHPDNTLLQKIPKYFSFDIVSCQFAMHYHFESEVRVRSFLKNVVTKLRNGGLFVGSIIDSNILVKKLRNSKNQNNKFKNEILTFGNDFYAVKFYQKHFPKDSPFGIKYGFYLEDSIDKRDEEGKFKYVGEYLIIFDIFKKIAEEFDLHLVEKKNFHELYEENMQNNSFKSLFKNMVRDLNSPFKEQQWEITNLYIGFCFRKGKEDGKRYTSFLNTIDHSKLFKDYCPSLITDKFD